MPCDTAVVGPYLLEGVEGQRHRHGVGVEDVDRVPALRLGVGADVGAVLVARAGLLDLVVHRVLPFLPPGPGRAPATPTSDSLGGVVPSRPERTRSWLGGLRAPAGESLKL